MRKHIWTPIRVRVCVYILAVKLNYHVHVLNMGVYKQSRAMGTLISQVCVLKARDAHERGC